MILSIKLKKLKVNFITKYALILSLALINSCLLGQEQPNEYIFFDSGLKIRLDSVKTHQEEGLEDPFFTFQDNTFFGVRSYYSSKPIGDSHKARNDLNDPFVAMSSYGYDHIKTDSIIIDQKIAQVYLGVQKIQLDSSMIHHDTMYLISINNQCHNYEIKYLRKPAINWGRKTSTRMDKNLKLLASSLSFLDVTCITKEDTHLLQNIGKRIAQYASNNDTMSFKRLFTSLDTAKKHVKTYVHNETLLEMYSEVFTDEWSEFMIAKQKKRLKKWMSYFFVDQSSKVSLLNTNIHFYEQIFNTNKWENFSSDWTTPMIEATFTFLINKQEETFDFTFLKLLGKWYIGSISKS